MSSNRLINRVLFLFDLNPKQEYEEKKRNLQTAVTYSEI